MGAARAAVLVVDDDEELRDWLARELTNHDFHVERASSGRMALEVQAKHRFDLALIDLRMPGMDGIETLVALKDRDPDLEAVVATGHATVPAAVASMKQGAFDFIQKPYTMRQLLPLLERALDKSRLQGALALHEASMALLGTRKATALLEQATATLRRMLRADAVAFALTQRDQIVVSTGEDASPPEEALVRRIVDALTAGESGLRLPDPAGRGTIVEPYGSAIATALTTRESRVGTLILFRRKDTTGFTAEEFRRALIFSGQLALALDNARLHEELATKVEEVTRTQDALIFSEKLALTGQLTAGVAHEINTPLTFVRFNLDFVVNATEKLLQDFLPAEEAETPPALASARHALDELRTAAIDAREGVERIVRIVRDLNMFAQPDRERHGVLDLAKVLDWAASVAAPQIRGSARLEKTYEPVPPIVGSQTRLGQVFVNLLVNAAQAIPKGNPGAHRITIRLRPDGKKVIAEVSDTGAGIDPALVDRIFEPFFTTKPLGTGTGLGLSICRTIVTEHGGTLSVSSAPGQGATFRVTLAAADASAPVERAGILRS